MQRFTISLEDKLADQFNSWIKRQGYSNRSEAVRDLVRERMAQESLEETKMPHCVASVVYVYDHNERELGRRLTRQQHQHHGLTVSTLHVHLDDEQCLEVTVLRGAGKAVSAQAQALVAERGVRNGKIHMVPMAAPQRPSFAASRRIAAFRFGTGNCVIGNSHGVPFRQAAPASSAGLFNRIGILRSVAHAEGLRPIAKVVPRVASVAAPEQAAAWPLR